ncbi:MAG: tRNA (guanosine(46)-N7)-methyltransferase TrmB [Quisquiliibacterium sp.]
MNAPKLEQPPVPEHPHIRSFSGRRGHFTSGQRQAYEQLLGRWSIKYQAKPLDLAASFGRNAPVVLEIGFGMGESTAQIAAARPQWNFLGVEVYPAGVGSLLMKIGAQQLQNLRIIQHDAIDVVRDMIAPASLAAVHLFFPDPWPKARHHKRRIIRPSFVELLASRLAPGGVLHCATDWEHYALQMLSVLSAQPLLENTAGKVQLGNSVAESCGFAPRPDYRPLTKFEQRGLRLGHGVWDILFRRRA